MPVPQDMVLFNDTIYYNILYGRLGATPEDVFAAARQAAVHDQVIAHLCAHHLLCIAADDCRHPCSCLTRRHILFWLRFAAGPLVQDCFMVVRFSLPWSACAHLH